jgi:hypothetical protein
MGPGLAKCNDHFLLLFPLHPCSILNVGSVVDPDPVDPLLFGLLDPDQDPYFLSQIQENFRKSGQENVQVGSGSGPRIHI